MINVDKIIFIVVFFAIFPAFLAYNLLLSLFSVPPFLGGYFTLVTAVLLPLLLYRNKIFSYDFLFIFMLCFFSINALINHFFGSSGQYSEALLHWSLVSIFNVFFLFLFFKKIDLLMYSKNYFFVVLFVLVYCCVILLNLSYGNQFNPRRYNENVSTYLVFSFLFVVPVSIIMAKTYLKSFAFWSLFLTVFLFFFFLLGSRSVVFFYLLAVIVTLLYFNGLSVKIWLGILLLFVVIILGSIFFSDFLTDNRVAKISLTDMSVKNRLLYLVFAVEEILKSPILGSYGAYAIEFDDVSTYPHNLILAWLNNGVLGFVIYLGVVLYPLFFYVGNRRSLLDMSRKFDSFLVLLFFSFLMYFFTLIKVVISDHYLTLYLGLALGSFSCVAYRYRALK